MSGLQEACNWGGWAAQALITLVTLAYWPTESAATTNPPHDLDLRFLICSGPAERTSEQVCPQHTLVMGEWELFCKNMEKMGRIHPINKVSTEPQSLKLWGALTKKWGCETTKLWIKVRRARWNLYRHRGLKCIVWHQAKQKINAWAGCR